MAERSLTRRLIAGLVPLVPYLWLCVLFLVPFLIVLKISLSDPAVAQPPYKPVFDWSDISGFFSGLDFENFGLLVEDDLYFRATLSSVRIAAVSTLLLLLVGFPIAYGMARAPERSRSLLVALIILPFWTSFLIRIYAWIAILKPEGLLNQALIGLGLISTPLDILNTETAVYIGIVYAYLPFMVLPLYATLEKMDDTLLEAALDLGSHAVALVLDDHRAACDARHRGRLAPMLHPGRGRVRDPRSFGRFGNPDDRPAALERVLLQPRLAARLRGRDPAAHHPRRAHRDLSRCRGPACGGAAMNRRLSLFNVTSLVLGFAFLYLPILLLVIYSFNASRLVTVWGGFSTQWYGALFRNQALMEAAWVTLRIAFLSATIATVLGTLAALALTRYGRFPGRTLFTGMVYAPMVMPEVITGLSLLLFFVAIDLDRGFWTITLAHTTLTMCFVTVVVQARLMTFDRSLEEAAMDLGAPPLRTFFTVTLPLIAPSIVAGFLLAFTLSMDDLVIASFNAGPGATTLPIKIYSQVRLGLSPEVNAASAILIGIVTLGVIAATLLSKRSSLRDRSDAH